MFLLYRKSWWGHIQCGRSWRKVLSPISGTGNSVVIRSVGLRCGCTMDRESLTVLAPSLVIESISQCHTYFFRFTEISRIVRYITMNILLWPLSLCKSKHWHLFLQLPPLTAKRKIKSHYSITIPCWEIAPVALFQAISKMCQWWWELNMEKMVRINNFVPNSSIGNENYLLRYEHITISAKKYDRFVCLTIDHIEVNLKKKRRKHALLKKFQMITKISVNI